MKKIGRYEVAREIGRGAMGIVYLAHDPRVRRPVAVKTFCMPAGLGAEQMEEYRERFRREAHAAGRLSHPGIVTVYDVDQDGETGLPFIAMEYVPGGSLLSLIQDPPIDPERAFGVVGEVADALHVAHREGVVHRDIKPANIMVRQSDDAVKIADFGVARVTTSELTQSGTSLGSPAYMSPEQIRGGSIDGRSDLFALAVILYELLCGVRPFSAGDTAALAYAVAHETPVPITRRVERLPGGLDAFFDRALAKDPDDRFPDGASFRAALAEARTQPARDVGEATVVAGDVAAAGLPAEPAACDPIDRAAPLPFAQVDSQVITSHRRFSIAAAALAAILILGGWAYMAGRNQAYLQLDGRSRVEAGELVLRIDGEKVYSRRLSAPRTGLLKKMLEQNQETFEARIKVPPGKHEVMASIMPDGADSAFRDTVVVDLESGETRRLRLVAGRALGSRLSLKVH